ncbi:hypothetical protein CONPUDRAFT_91792 [Coniophora puteana RWD-64-598 SS2]|uniref:Uncharacterized protein n=1 Tax=Coniophora puteana (strain RWD-64-598) TaxID=741705 RepID=A0A5M3MHR0_CONPW|nr:uncharacterized protein CONPUDRAFT_91792 [Coniophora puteana RWD-64-598 SS2]EIW78324.1 hypothetical protein CONPUDRAFT_91792 [Coniophora puteana RWD-64-598 SS2]
MSPSLSHRRHPSAPPAVVVQATKTPGLLSISKPARPSSRQQFNLQPPASNHKNARSPKQKQPQQARQSPVKADQSEDPSKASPAKKAADSDAVEKQEKTSSPQSPEKRPRGRQQGKPPKDKAPTSNAQTRRNNIRQPSPPIPSQAEDNASISSDTNRNPSSNSFDPFVVSSDSESDNSQAVATTVPRKGSTKQASPASNGASAGKPSRKRRAVPQAPTTPTPASKAVPIPRKEKAHTRPDLSRSAPIAAAAPIHANMRSSVAFSARFPVCDDTTDTENDDVPSTPTRSKSGWQQFEDSLTRSVPLPDKGFSFGVMNSPPPRARTTGHYRSPSEGVGVFNASFDEDMYGPGPNAEASEELKKLFGLLPNGTAHSNESRERLLGAFFANSAFQNSPSPDELPAPDF